MYIDVAFSLNRTLQVPLMVVVNSILRNAATAATAGNAGQASGTFRFNIVVPPGDRDYFNAQIQTAFAEDALAKDAIFRVEEFTPPDFLKHYLDTKFQEKKPERRISRYMQYARLFLKEIFPDVGRIIYLDGDVLVLGDLRSLHTLGEQLTPNNYLAACPQFFPAIFYFSNPFKVWSDLRKFKSSFNSGVLLTDLSLWNQQTYDLLKHYLDLDARNNYRLYHLGDETVFNLMFKDTYIPLDRRWNSCGYGQPHWITALLRKDPQRMSIIHWSGGHHKPWQSDRVIYSDLWRSYLPTALQNLSRNASPSLQQA
jgi:lipopolysaccharide biosynthesis glycosyltransferase